MGTPKNVLLRQFRPPTPLSWRTWGMGWKKGDKKRWGAFHKHFSPLAIGFVKNSSERIIKKKKKKRQIVLAWSLIYQAPQRRDHQIWRGFFSRSHQGLIIKITQSSLFLTLCIYPGAQISWFCPQKVFHLSPSPTFQFHCGCSSLGPPRQLSNWCPAALLPTHCAHSCHSNLPGRPFLLRHTSSAPRFRQNKLETAWSDTYHTQSCV